MSTEAQRAHDHAEHRLAVWDRFAGILRAGTALLVIILIAMVAWLGYRLDRNQDTLNRQDCIAHVNGLFFSHLADALAKQPASVNRQLFLNRMKDDAEKLKTLDESCPR